jgi:hypothetical protein
VGETKRRATESGSEQSTTTYAKNEEDNEGNEGDGSKSTEEAVSGINSGVNKLKND